MNIPDHLVSNACLATHPTAIVELLINQGCNVDSLVRASVNALNLPALELLMTKGANTPLAINISMKKGWISGVDHLVRLKVTGHPGTGQGTFSHNNVLYSYLPVYSEGFVKQYDEVTSSGPTIETEIQLKQNYIDEVQARFPECFARSQPKASKPGSMFWDRDQKEQKGKPERRVKLSAALHLNKMNQIIWGAKVGPTVRTVQADGRRVEAASRLLNA